MSDTLNLYEYQQNAVRKFEAAGGRGSVIYATGTGKTEVAIGIIDKFTKENSSGRVVFIVPRIVLIHQTAQRLSGYGFDSTAYFGGSKDLTGRIIVSTYQSLCKVDELETIARGWLESCGKLLFVFDEVHLASDEAENYMRIMKSVKDFTPDKIQMLALTATIDETSPKNATILSACPVIDRIEMGEAIEKGFLSEVEIIDSSVPLTPENAELCEQLVERIKLLVKRMGTSNPYEIKNYLFGSQGRDMQILAKAWFKAVNEKIGILNYDPNKVAKVQEIVAANKEKTLLFTERIKGLEQIQKAINDPTVFKFIKATTPPKVRAAIIEEFRTGKLQVLGTVHTLDIGFDQKDVMNCVFVASNKNDTQLIQRLGRGVRKAEGKTAAKIFVVYAKNTSEREVMTMIRDAVTKGRSAEQPTPEVQKRPEPKQAPFTLTWKKDRVSAAGNTYPYKDVLKRSGFWWNPNEKSWYKFCSPQELPEVALSVASAAGFEGPVSVMGFAP